MRTKKIVVVGDGACGKTCLLVTFTESRFPEEYAPTIYETSEKIITVNDEEVKLLLWDTAGEEDYDRLSPLSYPRTDLVLLCFAINAPDSLENVSSKWLPEIKHFLPRTPFILVGNKLDLRTDPKTISMLKHDNLQPVSENTGKKMAKKLKAAAYFECSAKTMFNVRQIFHTAAEIMLEESSKTKCKIL